MQCLNPANGTNSAPRCYLGSSGLFTSRYEDNTLSTKSLIFIAVVASVVFGVTWMDVQYMNSHSTLEANGESVEKPLQTASSSYRDVR